MPRRQGTGIPNYRVGFGKPPVAHRFPPGVSGNPKGRPRGSLNLSSILQRILKERVTIIENGRRRTVTKFEAAIKQNVNKAASGDVHALKILLLLVNSLEQNGTSPVASSESLNDSDHRIIQSVLSRLSQSKSGGTLQ